MLCDGPICGCGRGGGGLPPPWLSGQWELDRGEEFNLTSPAVIKQVLSEIRSGRVLAVMMAPPCSSFSIARHRTKVIRSRQRPWGIPKDMLTADEWQKVQQGNACFRTACRVARLCDRLRIPYFIENPASSKCWYLPPLQRLRQSTHSHVITLDFGQFGAKWLKPTTFLCGQCDLQDLHRLQRHCHRSGRICSRTGEPHFQLTGSNSQGIPWTRVARRALVFSLTAPFHR